MKNIILSQNINYKKLNDANVICASKNIVDKVRLNLNNGDTVIINSISDFNTVEDLKKIIIKITEKYQATLICINEPDFNIIGGKVDETIIQIIENMSTKEKSMSRNAINSADAYLISYTLLESISVVAQSLAK
ncbi:hypothetical protein [Clostridium butyricum]|uniref:hypothetical protein n=1 Tax=Clostridium butyricum TaxID=1492 RepID=UPI002ABE0EB7|nr:hypothetical protein [Clostridium butyricum]